MCTPYLLLTVCVCGRIMIGVHVRVHDPQFDWAVVASRAGGSEAGVFGEEAPLADFDLQMKAIEQRFTVATATAAATVTATGTAHTDSGQQHQSVVARHRFFIASNDMRVKKHFQRSPILLIQYH